MDYSTLDLDALRALPRCVLPAAYHLQDGSGNGCAGDPPGYPTYFTRNVYTQRGSNPFRGPCSVITYEGLHYVTLTIEEDWEQHEPRLHSLWRPLPLDHERTRLWIVSQYQHFRHCYHDVERPEYGRPGTLIFPVPHYKLKHFHDDERWKDAYRAAAQAEVDAFNSQEIERATAIATPENHKAVVVIRRYYPEYQPELELIEKPPKPNTPHWWETEAECPGPERCNETLRHYNGHTWTHPINTTWCQWCGWRAPDETGKAAP